MGTVVVEATKGATKALKDHLGYVGRQPGTVVRDSDAWYTPGAIIERVRAVLGTIDLDPFSSRAANETVRAAYYFDPTFSALDRPWRSPQQRRRYPGGVNVWMNPPYSIPLITQAIAAFVRAVQAGEVAQAIVLVNNATETRWFQRLCRVSTAVCFPGFRIAFTAPDGKAVAGNTRGQAFVYVPGTRNTTVAFLRAFADVGVLMTLEGGRHGEAE